MNDPDIIVVGLDDSPGARAALDVALDEGLTRGSVVRIVTAWIWETPYESMRYASTFEQSRAATIAEQQELVREVTARRVRNPEVDLKVVHANPGRALVAQSGDATFLVVGSGRKGPLSRTFMGSVSEYCVRHSPVPVLVVPDPGRVEPHHAEPAEERSLS